MHNKKFIFAVSNQRKCITNLRSLLIHFRQDFPKYKTQKVTKVIVYDEFVSQITHVTLN